MESWWESEDNLIGENNFSESSISSVRQKPVLLSYGFLSNVQYEHKLKNCMIRSVTYNSKTCEYIIADSRGIRAWQKNFASTKTLELMQYPPHNFNNIKILLYCRPLNLYFALTKEYILKVYNLNFHETFSIESDINALIHMVFNTATNELITASSSEIYIWRFGQAYKQNDSSAARFGLILRLKWEFSSGKLINRIALVEDQQKLLCLSETDVWCYDLFGKLIFIVRRACSTHLSACAYAGNTIVAGSVAGQVSLVTTTGGNIHTFHSHSNLITEIIIHPSDSQLIITASLDGYIKLFSMDLLEELYSLKVSATGIESMALRSRNLLYCVSTKEIEEFDLNYLCQFWDQLRYPAHSIELVTNGDKSNRVIVVDSGNTIKLFASNERRKICTILPPPTVDFSKNILPCAHDREYNLVYILITISEVWVYTTKTDPACFLAVIDLWDDTQTGRYSRTMTSSNPDPPVVPHLAKPKCYCIEILPNFFEVQFLDANGELQTKCNLLACGMDTGQIMLFNPIMTGRKENTIQICKDPIIQLKYSKELQSCMVTTKPLAGLLIKVINSNLEVLVSISCDSDITYSAIRGTTLALGFASGHIIVQDQFLQQQKALELHKQPSVDHNLAVLSLSFHPTLDILCSAGRDYCIKIWSFDKHLLGEITLDSSLTSACFLNSAGDILMGFKGHIFVMRNDGKYKWLGDDVDENDRPASRVYESPEIKYETRHIATPELETMDSYLVPYNDMIFMTMGTWVVKNDEAPSVGRDSNDALLSNLDSDDDSVAPSDIYQSSLFSLSSSGSKQWDLPDCGETPEGSVADEAADHYQESICAVENEVENESKNLVEESDNVHVTSRLDEILAFVGKKETTKPVRQLEFAHGSSEKLKKTKIDVKKHRIARSVIRGKRGGEKIAKAIPDHPLSENVKASNILREEKRRIVKKTQKPEAERKRAASRNVTAKKPLSADRSTQVETSADNEAIIPSPDGGYDSPLSHIDHFQTSETPEQEEQGVLLAKKAIQLKKGAFQTAEVGESDSIGQAVDEPGKESPSLLHPGYTSVDLEEDEVERHSDDLDASGNELLIERPRISSAQLGSDNSEHSYYTNAKSDSFMEVDITDITDRDTPPGDITTKPGSAVVKSPSLSSSVQKQKPRTPQLTQETMKMRVVPAYSQYSRQSSSAMQIDDIEQYIQESMSTLAVRSQKMKFHASKESLLIQKYKQESKKNEKAEEQRRPVRQGKASQAVRMAFGERLESQRILSSSPITLEKSKSSADPEVLCKEEKGPEQLLKFCVSAFRRNRKEKRVEFSRIFSADISEIKRKNETRLSKTVTDDGLRPKTAPVPQRTRSRKEIGKENSIDPMSVPSNVFKSFKSRGTPENGITDLGTNDQVSVQGENYQIGTDVGKKVSHDTQGRSTVVEVTLPSEQVDFDAIREVEDFNSQFYVEQGNTRSYRSGFITQANVRKGVPMTDTYGRAKRSDLDNRPSMHQSFIKRSTTNATEVSYGKDISRKSSDKGTETKETHALMSKTELINSPSDRQYDDADLKRVSRQYRSTLRHIGSSDTGLSTEGTVTRTSSKGKVLFVDMIGEATDTGEANVDPKVVRSSSEYELIERKSSIQVRDKVARVMSPQERLLKHRAASADMNRRQENAKFRRKVIEQQRMARFQNRSISPAYSQEYLREFLPEQEEEVAPTATYVYNKPTPLHHDGQLNKSEEMKGLVLFHISTNLLP